ncbi:phage terminase large subunit [Qipengyuania sp. NPDC077410]|uniref:phage terminase large subunit n=1 Tax=Qipengyuania sp. NPDC077410 TaxID=3364496 RepID=UPI0037CAF5A4
MASTSTKTKPQGIRPNFEGFNDDQRAAYALATSNNHKFHLFYGGAGSGKSWLIMFIVLLRALRAPDSRHAIFRLTRASCEQTLFDKTLIEVLQVGFPGLYAQLVAAKAFNYTDMTVTLPNGSKLFFNGLDENRLTKVLGDEFNTVWVNECNEDGLSYATVNVLLNRLRAVRKTVDGKVLKNKMFFDCNPRFYSDWEYKVFMQGINPEDGDAIPRPEQWVNCKLRTFSNQANLSEDYLENLELMGAKDRRRYMEGEWSDQNQHALFTEKVFVSNRIPKPKNVITPQETLQHLREQEGIELNRVTVSADPAVTADPKSDLTGITVQGIYLDANDTEHAVVLEDLSARYTPDAACKVIAEAYREWGASRVIMEKNQGGLWLESTLRKHFPNVPLKFVSATTTTGGKASRAEPVAAQYERGVVHHVGSLKELENQMCDFGSPASRKKSPDRMDAVVWGLTELFDLGAEKRSIPGVRISRKGYRR